MQQIADTTQFSPDSKTILMIDRNGARIRNLKTGRLKELSLADEPSRTGHKRLLDRFDFLEGGKLLVGVIKIENETSLARLRVWDVPTGRVLLQVDDIESEAPQIPSFQRSADGSTLAYAMGRPGPLTVGVWRNTEGWERRYFAGGVPLALSPDGKKLALIEPTESEAKLMLWDVEKSEPLGSIELGSKPTRNHVAFSPDGRWLAVVDDGTTILYDASSLENRHVLKPYTIGEPWFSPDGKLFAQPGFSDRSGLTEIWDLDADPIRINFYGCITAMSSDGHRFIQSGPNYAGSKEPVLETSAEIPQQLMELSSFKQGNRFVQVVRGNDGRGGHSPYFPHISAPISWNYQSLMNCG